MKDILKDIVKNTLKMGGINTVKIQGTADQTWLYAMPEDFSFYAKAKFHTVIEHFDQTFGLPNLNQLDSMLNCPLYDEESTITAVKNSKGVLEALFFSNKDQSYQNNYRLMSTANAELTVPSKNFKGATWHHTLEPQASSILKFKYQSQTHNDTNYCRFYTEKNNLIAEFGDPSNGGHVGKFVFEPNVTALVQGCEYPVQRVLSVLSLAGDKQIKLSNDGVMEITVDSGLAFYDYKIMALSK